MSPVTVVNLLSFSEHFKTPPLVSSLRFGALESWLQLEMGMCCHGIEEVCQFLVFARTPPTAGIARIRRFLAQLLEGS